MTYLALCAAFSFGWAGKAAWNRANAQFEAQVAAELAVGRIRRSSFAVSAADVDGRRW